MQGITALEAVQPVCHHQVSMAATRVVLAFSLETCALREATAQLAVLLLLSAPLAPSLRHSATLQRATARIAHPATSARTMELSCPHNCAFPGISVQQEATHQTFFALLDTSALVETRRPYRVQWGLMPTPQGASLAMPALKALCAARLQWSRRTALLGTTAPWAPASQPSSPALKGPFPIQQTWWPLRSVRPAQPVSSARTGGWFSPLPSVAQGTTALAAATRRPRLTE